MNDQILDSPVTNQRTLEYAGFWIRVGANLIDGFLLGIVNGILTLLGGGFDSPNPLMSLISTVIGVAYVVIMESSEGQATLGKKAVGIKVGDANGDRISVANALGRYFAKFLSFIILCIGFMMVGWDDKKQGLHDKLASTYVFYGK